MWKQGDTVRSDKENDLLVMLRTRGLYSLVENWRAKSLFAVTFNVT